MERLRYSMSWDALVGWELIEDPTLTVPMKLAYDGKLYVKGQFIEETRSYGFPPIPAPVGTMSFDTFEYYADFSNLGGLNSGSNEWDNKTPLAAYAARWSRFGIRAFDLFLSWSSGTSLSESNNITGGIGEWVGAYAGKDNVWAYRIDTFLSYSAGLPLIGLGSGDTGFRRRWLSTWDTRSGVFGVRGYENFDSFSIDAPIAGSGSTLISDYRWNYWVGNWETASSFGIIARTGFISYSLSMSIDGSGSQLNEYLKSNWNRWGGEWDVRLNVTGSI